MSLWIGGFFVVAAIFLLTWVHLIQRQASLAELQKLAETNTGFLSDLGLPYSPRLAAQLSEILNMGVGFQFDQSLDGRWPDEIKPELRELLKKYPRGVARRIGNREVAFAPLPEKKGHFILIRDLAEEGKTSGKWWTGAALPLAILAFGCAALAFGLGKSIVSPLSELTRWLPNLRDGSANEPVQNEISTRSDEVGQLARALNSVKEQLTEEKEWRAKSERMAALGRIATSLAHEVKNPAAAIRLHTDLLLEQSGESHEPLKLIREEIDQITDLVNQWLFVSKPAPSARRPHRLEDLLKRVLARMSGLLEDRGFTFRLEFEEGETFPVVVDAPRLEQVFRNLIQNAIEAIRDDSGDISVRIGRDGANAVIDVRDNGSGFSSEALHHFGEPFFSEREGGMGIGLTLACEVVRAHEGQISGANLEDEDNTPTGAVVTVTLPRDRTGEKT